MTPEQESAAQTCLNDCVGHISRGAHEATLRSVFNSHLRGISGTPLPWWAEEHIVKTEAILRTARAGRMVIGFADNLVGLTAIEYEKNLTNAGTFQTGYDQVCQYVAGLLNLGAPASSVLGVLSDTVRWHAYEVASVAPTATIGRISATDVTLQPAAAMPSVDCSAAGLTEAQQLHAFLKRHLGRNAGQVLSASTLREMFGLESQSGMAFVSDAEAVVDTAFAADPNYAGMVRALWAGFVSFVGTAAQAGQFDKQAYVYELYLLTLAKLIAANVLNGSALISTPNQLHEILDGRHFKAQGLTNLVEYDYFGWLTESPHVSSLLQLAAKIQVSLQAFNYTFLRAEDLFGQLVTQLAQRTQRLLLGQEPTPGWLVAKMVDAIQARMAANEPWRFVDPCCGSGAFVVEVIARKTQEAGFAVLSREQQGQELTQTITGFDIDPLAVMLAKVSWLIAARTSLQFRSDYPLSIPIYHADSLFALTPLAQRVVMNAAGDFDLSFHGQHISLPGFLASPQMQGFFDAFIDSLYRIGQAYAAVTPRAAVPLATIQQLLSTAANATATTLAPAQAAQCESFGQQFADIMADLERNGRNGLWLHMLKNGYRPALVQGKFNGVVTNFPWLALSKLAVNPYIEVLREKTDEFQLRPVPQSIPHLELATIFMVHAANHYLGARGHLAAVVPNSVIQGSQHEPLRAGLHRQGPQGVPLDFVEVWDADRQTFGTTNVAAVLVAEKGGTAPAGIQGRFVKEGAADVLYPYFLSSLNNRNAWTKVLVNSLNGGSYGFRQGADIMPRTTWLHDVAPVHGAGGTSRYNIAPIVGANSPFNHLIAGAKKCPAFRAVATNVSADWGFELLMSVHLLQFVINEPAVAILPLQHRSAGHPSIESAGVASFAVDPSAQTHFQRAYTALEHADGCGHAGVNVAYVFGRLNLRNKLTAQQFSAGDRLVLFGAGGGYPAAASLAVTAQNASRLIIDQTLYWMVVNDADEADYLTGLINSACLAETIRPFQPVGLSGPRHVHELPLAVIPAWNPTDPLHSGVVIATRQLQADLLTAIASTPELQALVATPSTVSVRRKALRKAIEALPSYSVYEAACALVV